MSLILNLIHSSFRRVVCTTLAIAFLLVGSEANAQVFGRLRSVPRNSQTSGVPQMMGGTRGTLSPNPRQSLRNGYLPDSQSAVKGELRTSGGEPPVVPPQRDSGGRTGKGVSPVLRSKNGGIGAAIDVSSETSSSTESGRAVPSSLELGTNEVREPVSPLLARNMGKFDFIAAVKTEDIDSYVASVEGLCVVVPHKNFIISSQSVEDGRDQRAASVVVEAVMKDETSEEGDEQTLSDGDSAVDPSFYEDYIVFTLTNLAPQEAQLLRDATDGRWNDFDLLSASLIAEGLTTSESREHYRSRFESLVSSLLSQTKHMQDQLQKTERVYNFLHSRALFSKYDLTCSSVAASLDSGVFNCVSATILFNCLASRAGLRVAALETTGHAKSRVKFDESFLDIETTCSTWNKLPDRMRPYQISRGNGNVALADGTSGRRQTATFSNVSLKSTNDTTSEEGSTTFQIDSDAPLGYSFTRSRRPMREITDVELVATIYYNVGVDFSQAGDYERSIASYIKAVQLAPGNKTILGNLKATINNWAIDVAMKEKDYEKAIHLTELGQRIDPDFREFKMNMPIFYHDWIERLTKENDWEAVQRVQDEYLARFPK